MQVLGNTFLGCCGGRKRASDIARNGLLQLLRKVIGEASTGVRNHQKHPHARFVVPPSHPPPIRQAGSTLPLKLLELCEGRVQEFALVGTERPRLTLLSTTNYHKSFESAKPDQAVPLFHQTLMKEELTRTKLCSHLSGHHQSSPPKPSPDLHTPRCHKLVCLVFGRRHDRETDGAGLENVSHIRLPTAGPENTQGDGEAKLTAPDPNEGAGPFMFMRKLAVIQLKSFKRCHLG